MRPPWDLIRLGLLFLETAATASWALLVPMVSAAPFRESHTSDSHVSGETQRDGPIDGRRSSDPVDRLLVSGPARTTPIADDGNVALRKGERELQTMRRWRPSANGVTDHLTSLGGDP